MGFFGPKTGAGDGNKEYKQKTNLRGRDTGARYKDEERKERNRTKEERHARKLQEKNGWGLW